MSDSESFLARWSRLKHEQAARPATSEVPSPDRTTAPVDPSPPSVDLASLPPLESLGPDSDISAYLSAGIPPELTQAALRRAWRADPAIRDFVEIADNQWDFNAPEAMPGFGALGAAQQATERVARAMAASEKAATTLASVNASGDRAESQVVTGMTLEESRVVDPVWHAGAGSLPKTEQPLVETPEGPLAEDTPTHNRRMHGSALPK